MANYYETLINALKIGDVTRITSLDKKEECLLQNNKVIYGESIDKNGDFIVETIKPEVHLVLFGAGHIAKAIHDIASILKMNITVLDEREEILNEERFPNANRILMPYDEIFKTDFSYAGLLCIVCRCFYCRNLDDCSAVTTETACDIYARSIAECKACLVELFEWYGWLRACPHLYSHCLHCRVNAVMNVLATDTVACVVVPHCERATFNLRVFLLELLVSYLCRCPAVV